MDDNILILKAFVEISSYREKVVRTLENEPKIPTKIAKDIGILPNHISKVLSDLKKNELIECINPEMRKGRLYKLTPKGNEVLMEMKR